MPWYGVAESIRGALCREPRGADRLAIVTATKPGPPTMDEPPLGTLIERIPVSKVSPVIEGGAYPAKATVGEAIPIRATVFREGHDAVNASVV